MLHPSTKKLIDRLAEMTAQRKISWALGETDKSIVYETEGYRVLLEGSPLQMRLTDALGSELETASSDDLKATKHADGGSYADILDKLHTEALRVAKGTETAISAVLQGLADEATTPETPVLKTEVLEPSVEDKPKAATAPDIVEDVADEAGMPSKDIDTDIPDVGKAVATLADQVNGGSNKMSERQSRAPETRNVQEPVSQPVKAEPPATPKNVPASTKAEAPAEDGQPNKPAMQPGNTGTIPPSSQPTAETLDQPASSQPAQTPVPPKATPPQTPRRNIGNVGGFGDLSAYRKKPPAAPIPPVAQTPPANPVSQETTQTPKPTPPKAMDPGPAPAGPAETVRAGKMPADVRAVLDEVTAQPAAQSPQPAPPTTPPTSTTTPPQTPSPADTRKAGETVSLSGLTSGIGLGPVSSEGAASPAPPTSSAPEPSPAPQPPTPTTPQSEPKPTDTTDISDQQVEEETAEEGETSGSPSSRFNPWM
ncbi:MAG: hypothetical protein AAF950_06440 [Pseudomonadota bacterium]